MLTNKYYWLGMLCVLVGCNKPVPNDFQGKTLAEITEAMQPIEQPTEKKDNIPKKLTPEEQYQKAKDYLLKESASTQDVIRGVKWLKSAAKAQYTPAEYLLTQLYLQGYPVFDKPEEALGGLYHAAKAGNPKDQLALAQFLLKFGHPQFDKAARSWLQQAAKTDVAAKFLLADFYQQGIGGEVDYDKTISILTQLAEDQQPKAYYRLGLIYYLGKGIEQDFGKAYHYLTLAEQQGIKKAGHWLSLVLLGIERKNEEYLYAGDYMGQTTNSQFE